MFNFTPFPNLETKNLLLKRLNYTAIDDLHEMRKDPRMNEYVDVKPDESINETKEYIDKMNRGIDDNKWIIWAIEHKQSEKVIGTISIWNINSEHTGAELGYGIIPDYQGKGLMKEALLRVIEYGFDVMFLKYLEAYTEENNFKSLGLLERCNFKEVDKISEEGYFNCRVYNMIIYRLNNDKPAGFESKLI
jgi:ribosomal-protein-alanine N-acetyltransferase